MNHQHDSTWYWKSLDFDALTRDFPPPPDYFDKVFRISRDELRARQEKRFLETVNRGWEIPFFQRHWGGVGIAPGDIRTLDDLTKLPPYTVKELRESIDRNPPFGDFMGISPADGARMPLVLQTSGGTTGLPRPMLYAPQDRETMAILGGRRFALQGVRPGDLVILTADHGCDPTTPSTDHSREYVPLLVYGPGTASVNLGTRATLSDIGQTVAENFGASLSRGSSFLDAL